MLRRERKILRSAGVYVAKVGKIVKGGKILQR